MPAALDLRSIDRSLSTWQHRFFDAELPRALRLEAFTPKAVARYRPEVRDWALRAWQARSLDEYRSLVGLNELLLELTELGASFDLISVAVRVVRDEARHVELCRRLTLALGGDGVMPGAPSWVRSDTSRPLLERVLDSVVGSLCVGETLSAAFLAATLQVTTAPLARGVVRVLTADESIHSQLGWKTIELFWPTLTKAQRRHVERTASSAVKAVHTLAFEGSQEERRARNPFGDLLHHERQAVFTRSLDVEVLKRFARLGISVRA